jgi:hypothetical protein
MRFYNDIAVHDDDVIRRIIIIIIKYYYYGFSRLAVYNNIRIRTLQYRIVQHSSAVVVRLRSFSSSDGRRRRRHDGRCGRIIITPMFLYRMEIIFNHLIAVRRVLSFTLSCRRHNRQYMHRTYTRDYNRLYTRNTRAYT